MPMYNAAPFVAAAVESVLTQTFTDFELLVLDDGSTDTSAEVVRSFRDPRLVLLSRPHAGVVASMSAALEAARAPIVARADADDVCVPVRLARQVEYLRANPGVALVGAAIREDGRVLAYPPDLLRIRWTVLYRSPFAGPTLMFRRDAALAVGGYPRDYYFVDDYPFVSRMIARFEAANLGEVLVTKRINPTGITGRHSAEQIAEGDRVRLGNLESLLGPGSDARAVLALLTGRGTPPPADRVAPLLERLADGFRRRWGVEPAAWRALARWVGRELFDLALRHAAHPAVLVRMAAYACRLDPALAARPRFAKGLVRHLVLERLRR